MANYMIAQLDELKPLECPCGLSRRAFISPENTAATLHIVDTTEDAQPHYHKKLTEIYLVLEGTGQIELDGKLSAVKPLTSIFIKAGCRHRIVGKMRIVNICIPAFDSEDEWFD